GAPDGSDREQRDEQQRPAEQRCLEQQRDERHEKRFGDGEQRQDAQQLPDVQRRPGRRREQQRAERLAVPLALERAAQGERAGERNRDPQNAGGGISLGLPFLAEGEREAQP